MKICDRNEYDEDKYGRRTFWVEGQTYGVPMEDVLNEIRRRHPETKNLRPRSRRLSNGFIYVQFWPDGLSDDAPISPWLRCPHGVTEAVKVE
jgi:hypothetical protein